MLTLLAYATADIERLLRALRNYGPIRSPSKWKMWANTRIIIRVAGSNRDPRKRTATDACGGDQHHSRLVSLFASLESQRAVIPRTDERAVDTLDPAHIQMIGSRNRGLKAKSDTPTLRKCELT